MKRRVILVFVPPAIQGLGFVGGFQMQVEDREGVGSGALQERAQAIAWSRPASAPRWTPRRRGAPSGRRAANLPEHRPRQGGEDGREDGRRLQHAPGEPRLGVRQRLQQVRRVYQVRVQADAKFRGDTEVIERLEVPGRDAGTNPDGSQRMGPRRTRVPLGTLLSDDIVLGPQSYPLQPVPDRPDSRPRRAGRQFAGRDRRDGSSRGERTPADDGLRVDGVVVPGEESQRIGVQPLRQPIAEVVSSCSGWQCYSCTSCSRAVRELAAAVRGDPRGAAGAVGRGSRGAIWLNASTWPAGANRRASGLHRPLAAEASTRWTTTSTRRSAWCSSSRWRCKNAILIVEFSRELAARGSLGVSRRRWMLRGCGSGRSS